jgi:hypothetical protein
LALMRWIDEQYLATPFYGSRRMTAELRRASHRINRKWVQRLMRLMGLEALGPKPKTSRPSAQRRHCVANGLDFGADAGNRGGSAPLPAPSFFLVVGVSLSVVDTAVPVRGSSSFGYVWLHRA